jgi:hypothetical protein
LTEADSSFVTLWTESSRRLRFVPVGFRVVGIIYS